MNEYRKWIPVSITGIRLILAPFLWAALDQFAQGWALLLTAASLASRFLHLRCLS